MTVKTENVHNDGVKYLGDIHTRQAIMIEPGKIDFREVPVVKEHEVLLEIN